jgi:hypothetical protein
VRILAINKDRDERELYLAGWTFRYVKGVCCKDMIEKELKIGKNCGS